MKSQIYLFIFVFFTLSCRKERMVDDYSKYVGEYQWLYTVGGWAPVVTSPFSEGYQLKLEIKKSGRCFLFLDNEKISKGKITKHNNQLFIELNDKNKKDIYINDNISEFKNDTLIIGGGCCDKPSSIYLKTK